MDGELLQILLQAEKKAQGNAEKLLPDTPRKEEIKEENVLRQKEINILGQWQQASYCWIRFDPWTIFFHSILYIEVLYHFVSLYMKVCHTSFMLVLSEQAAIPRYLLVSSVSDRPLPGE